MTTGHSVDTGIPYKRAYALSSYVLTCVALSTSNRLWRSKPDTPKPVHTSNPLDAYPRVQVSKLLSSGWKCAIVGVPWRGSVSAFLAWGDLFVKSMF